MRISDWSSDVCSSDLASRGLRTLKVRLSQHQAGALEVAQWLAQQPEVARVLHPALPGCPGHALWKRDFTGARRVFAFVLNGGSDAGGVDMIEGLQSFGVGCSWGGNASLAVKMVPQKDLSAKTRNAESTTY